MRNYYVFILVTGPDSEFDFGVTSNLATLPPERLARLVWCEEHIDLRSTLRRERQLQHAAPDWTRRLIDQTNPAWSDLRDEIAQARAA